MESVLQLWRMRNLRTEGKTVVFKSLELSKLNFHFYISKVSNEVVRELKNIQK